MIETTKKHLHRNLFHLPTERDGDLQAQAGERSVEESRGVALTLHTVATSYSQVEETKQSFGQRIPPLNSPPQPVERVDFARQKLPRKKGIGQVVAPGPAP